MSNTILVRQEGRVVVLTFNRPEKLNALSTELRKTFHHKLLELLSCGNAVGRAVLLEASPGRPLRPPRQHPVGSQLADDELTEHIRPSPPDFQGLPRRLTHHAELRRRGIGTGASGTVLDLARRLPRGTQPASCRQVACSSMHIAGACRAALHRRSC